MTRNGLTQEVSGIASDSGSVGAVTVQDLYQTAALILASQDEAVAAFEKAVASADFDPDAEPASAYQRTRDLVTQFAVERAVALDPLEFAPQSLGAASDVCLDTDDWEATGVTASHLGELMAGTGQTRLRDWLEHLRPASRVIFVLRAILGKDSRAVVKVLADAQGPASGWTSEQVGQVFRGALCSLATSLVHAPVAR